MLTDWGYMNILGWLITLIGMFSAFNDSTGLTVGSGRYPFIELRKGNLTLYPF